MNTLFTEIKNKIDNGQPDDAILMANQLIKEGNEDAYLYYLKGRAYMKKSDWKKAIDESYGYNRTVFITGSLYFIAQVREYILNKK